MSYMLKATQSCCSVCPILLSSRVMDSRSSRRASGRSISRVSSNRCHPIFSRSHDDALRVRRCTGTRLRAVRAHPSAFRTTRGCGADSETLGVGGRRQRRGIRRRGASFRLRGSRRTACTARGRDDTCRRYHSELSLRRCARRNAQGNRFDMELRRAHLRGSADTATLGVRTRGRLAGARKISG